MVNKYYFLNTDNVSQFSTMIARAKFNYLVIIRNNKPVSAVGCNQT